MQRQALALIRQPCQSRRAAPANEDELGKTVQGSTALGMNTRGRLLACSLVRFSPQQNEMLYDYFTSVMHAPPKDTEENIKKRTIVKMPAIF